MTNDQSTTTADNGTAKNKPVAEFRYGPVRAVVWGNRSEYGVRYSVKLSRSYMKDDQWYDTDYLDRNDILKAIQALGDAGRFVFTGVKAGSGSTAPEPALPANAEAAPVNA